MRARELPVCQALRAIGLLLIPALALSYLSKARADAPAGPAADEPLPEGALLRLGTDRFRQEGEVIQERREEIAGWSTSG